MPSFEDFHPILFQASLTVPFGSIFTIHDIDVIKVLEDGDLQTIGLLDYDKRLSHSFTAHPKVDPVTGKINSYALALLK